MSARTTKTAHTARSMTQILRRHYLPEGRVPGGLFADEIGSPDGRRRADAIWMPTTVAGGTGLVGHEIKVSRSDVIVELAEPAKADPWCRFCDRWWLVVSDPDLVAGLEVPEAWGVMAPPSGRRTRTMTVLREAPKLNPVEQAPALRRIAAWQMYGTADRLASLEHQVKRLQADVDRERAASDRATLGAQWRDSPSAKRLQGILAQLDKAQKAAHIWSDLPDDQIVAALLDVAATRQATEDARFTLRQLLSHVQELTSDSLLNRLAERLTAAQVTAESLKSGTP